MQFLMQRQRKVIKNEVKQDKVVINKIAKKGFKYRVIIKYKKRRKNVKSAL
jgi:hypothetical protein